MVLLEFIRGLGIAHNDSVDSTAHDTEQRSRKQSTNQEANAVID